MGDAVAMRPESHLRPAAALTVVGAACVVTGGLVAAVTGPLDLAHGSWTAAYLVLVGGVAQYAMGRIRARQERSGPGQPLADRWVWRQLVLWNLGNAGVIGGTLSGEPLGVDLGSALLVPALAIGLADSRRGVGDGSRRTPAALVGYRILLAIMLVSIPVGILLSHLRH